VGAIYHWRFLFACAAARDGLLAPCVGPKELQELKGQKDSWDHMTYGASY